MNTESQKDDRESGRITDPAKRKECILTALYLLIFFVVASSIALAQPLVDDSPMHAGAPDEYARYLVPKYICEHGFLPSGYDEEVRIPYYGSSYALFNILPYIIMGWFMRLVAVFTDNEYILLYCARFVNVIMGTVMAFVVRRLALRIFDAKARKIYLDWLFCMLVMYLPQSLFLHTYVNTDSMAMLSTALILYALVCIYQNGFCKLYGAVLCTGVIFCALSYYNAYGYIVSAVLLCLAYFLKKEQQGKITYDWKEMLRWAIPITAVVFCGTVWWYVHNYHLYDGDMLGLRTANHLKELYGVSSVNPLYSLTYQQLGYTPWKMMKERNFVASAYASFVAVYGSMSIAANIWIYRIYKIYFFVGIAGYLITIPFYAKNHEWKRLFFHANLFFCIVMPVFLTIYYAYTSDYQAQGRYMMPILIPLMLYLVKGLERLRARITICPDKLAAAGVSVIMVSVVIMLFWMVYGTAMPIYRMTGVVPG